MTGSETNTTSTSDGPCIPVEQSDQGVRQQRQDHSETRRWWLRLLIQPLLLLTCGALLLTGLALSQRMGWISAGSGDNHSPVSHTGSEPVRYICPMMCTPPQAEPGRCPICAMELVPANAGSDNGDSNSIQIDPVARRVANIHTVAVQAMSAHRTIRAVGELSYDERMLKTISAYVDGRIEQLCADYTGVFVQKGDHLALLYSPRLYSGQVEFLLAKKNGRGKQSTRLQQVLHTANSLEESARQRLIEFGMTVAQVAELPLPQPYEPRGFEDSGRAKRTSGPGHRVRRTVLSAATHVHFRQQRRVARRDHPCP